LQPYYDYTLNRLKQKEGDALSIFNPTNPFAATKKRLTPLFYDQ
jgi:hypothetical protein